MITAIVSHIKFVIASTYGSGTFNGGTYNGIAAANAPASNVQIGPLSLPVTGAGLSIIVGIVVLAIAAGLFVWLYQRRRQAAPVQ